MASGGVDSPEPGQLTSRAPGDTDRDTGAAAPDRFLHAPVGLVVLDAGGVVNANDEACALLGCAKDVLLGAGLASSLDEASAAAFRRDVAAALAGTDGSGGDGSGGDGSGGDGSGGDDVGGDDVGGDDVLVVQRPHEPGRFLAVRFGPSGAGTVVASITDVTMYFHAMMLLAYSANTTMVIDPEAQILWGPVGRYAAQEMGSPWYGRGEANPLGWLHPEDMGRVLDAFTHVLAHPGLVHELTVRTRHVILEDQWGTAMIRAINLMDNPLIGGVLVQTHAEGEEHKVSLGRTTGSFQSIAESAPIGIILSNHLGRPLYWNTVARDLFDLGPIDRSDGATDEDVDWVSTADDEHVAELRQLLTAALTGERGRVTARFSLPSGAHWLTVTVAPQLNDVGEPMGWLATLQDITHEREIQAELGAAQERLIHLAGHDPLTGLANRRLFAGQLERAMSRATRDQQGVALLFCDLDGFKNVNDALGHEVGDRVLAQVAKRLTDAIRSNDMAARVGGDEFVVLVEGFDEVDEVEVVARRLIDALGRPFRVDDVDDDAVTAGATATGAAGRDGRHGRPGDGAAGPAAGTAPRERRDAPDRREGDRRAHDRRGDAAHRDDGAGVDAGDPSLVRIGVSIGIAIGSARDTPDMLVSRADDLMYEAKASGRGRYVLEPAAAF